MLVIADEHKAVALAGVMGGANSEVSDSTQDVFLESALLPRKPLRARRRLGFSSDASFYSARGLHPASRKPWRAPPRWDSGHLRRPGRPVTEAVGQLPARAPVKVRVARVNQVLGLR